MRQLLPFPRDPVDPAVLYGDLPSARTRPAVRLNMIASIDGATAVGGVSGGLGGPADQALFAVLRSQADVVLVAAGTVRAEHYGPLDVPVAVLSRSCRLDWDSAFFTAAITPPIVVTVAEAPALERKKAADRADVIIAGERDVDLAAAKSAAARIVVRAVRRVVAASPTTSSVPSTARNRPSGPNGGVRKPPGAGTRPISPDAAYRAAASRCSATRCSPSRVAARRAGGQSALPIMAVMPVPSRRACRCYETRISHLGEMG